MSLSDSSIKNPVFAWMLLIGIVAFGILAFWRLGLSQLPDVDMPVINVSVNWEGASAEVVETEITDALEEAVLGVQGVQEVTSTSRKGHANVTVQFDISKNVDTALQEIQSRIARAQHDLPRDIDPPFISKSNPEDQPILWITLSGDRPMKEMMMYTRNVLKDQFSTIDGVGEISLGGFMEPNLRVWLDADKMREKELTVDDVASAISTEHSEVPAGYIDTGKKEMNIRVAGEAETVDEFTSIIIPARRGSPLWKTFRIGDVARVEDGTEDVRRISRASGKLAVSIGIRKQRGTNSVKIAKEVRAKLGDMQKYLPDGMSLDIRFDSTRFIEDSMHEMYFILILSVLLTGTVCWLFLGSFSSALNVFLTIPMSLCGAFFVIYIMGFTLNTFTLLGLSLVVGIVVDDAIMMLENIVRHRESGETRVKAAIKGAREITFAAIAASVAILAIFIPVIFMSGVIGRYFFQFGVTISVAVAVSLLGALTLTPMFCAQFLSSGHTTGIGKAMDSLMNTLREKYRILLAWCLKRRWQVIITALLLFCGSLFLFKTVRQEFVPAQDLGMLSVRMQTKPGTSLEITDGIFKQAEQILSKMPFVDSYFDFIGGSSGNIMVSLKKLNDRPVDPKKKRPLTQQELMPVLRKALKDIPGTDKVVVQDPSLLGLSARRGYPIEFTIGGPDWEKLIEYSGVIEKEINDTGLMTDIDSDYDQGPPELQVLPDRKKAAERGVSISVIGKTINALIGGTRAGKYTHDGRRYDIRLQLVSKDRSRPDDISKIWVRNNRGEIIRLSDVVTISEKPAQLSITRKNRERAIRMFANVVTGKSQAAALEKVRQIGKKTLPEGYRLVFSGSAQTFQESFNSLYLVLFLGIFVAYMVLGTQFNSFVHPFTVLLALPFSISGALLALEITGRSLNIYSAIGLILLMGIVKKNSILLVDFTNRRRDEGMAVNDALLNACPIRLRPILMTSIATISAAVPPALALGPGAETRIPMAVVVIGGVMLSTLLTLFVVPCVYSLVSKLESVKHRKDVRDALGELAKS
ncbi:MAG: efflux RND transporter permease subunit [Elusimicrobiota bacterium]